MFCIDSPTEPTKVINSRTSKKSPLVWRRRRGTVTGRTFTTYERPSLADARTIQRPDGSSDTFNLGRLIVSIAAAFAHDLHAAQYDSLWIAQTVEDTLLRTPGTLQLADITATTYHVLSKYDNFAAVQYAAKHRLATGNKPR